MTTTTLRLRGTHPWRAAGVAIAAVGIDATVDPTRTHVPLCPLHAITGAWCPLCGGLRAISALVHGDLTAAARDNVLVVAAVPVVCAMWLLAVVRPERPVRFTRRVWTGVVLVAVAFAVARNVPGGAFLHP